MEIKEIKIEKIKPYKNNTKKHPDYQVGFIENSIKEFGFRQPLVLDKNNVVVIGHGRLLAAKNLGMESVPCVYANDLTEEQIKALRIADNKTAERSEWDDDLLKVELTNLGADFDMTDFGFGDFELTVLKGDFEPEPYDNEETKEYDDKSEDFLAKKRVIITYTDDDEQELAEILGLAEIKKVVYDVSELLG